MAIKKFINNDKLSSESISIDYSTEEQVIGTWINGQPLYRKVINLGQMPNAETKQYNYTLPGAYRIIKYSLYALGNAGEAILIPYCYPSTDFMEYWITCEGVTLTTATIIAGVDRRNFTGMLIIDYTKGE